MHGEMKSAHRGPLPFAVKTCDLQRGSSAQKGACILPAHREGPLLPQPLPGGGTLPGCVSCSVIPPGNPTLPEAGDGGDSPVGWGAGPRCSKTEQLTMVPPALTLSWAWTPSPAQLSDLRGRLWHLPVALTPAVVPGAARSPSPRRPGDPQI